MRLPIIAVVGILLTVVVLIALPFMQTPDVPQSGHIPPGYNLIWNDEFQGSGLDGNNWRYRYPTQEYLAGFTDEKSVMQPEDGYLHLVTRFDGNKFLVGMIESKKAFRYGYFEARIRFQRLQGHHGAFWLQSPLYNQFLNDPGKSGAEIDIIEFFGNGRTEEDAQHNVYWNPYNSPDLQHRQRNLYIRRDNGVEISKDFHLFALLWTPDEYIFFIDGVESWRLKEGISQTEQNIVLSLVTAEWENKRLDTSKLPDEMLVDYVRVYQP